MISKASVVANETSRAPEKKLAGVARARISLVMIVRDEEPKLAACLGSVADIVNEMIVVDTGSTDRSREVAKACGAKVFDFRWVDDFAAARNESMRQATGEWILWLDADETFDEANRERLRYLSARLPPQNIVYMMKQCSVPERAGQAALVLDHPRLFRKQPAIRWTHRVHEQILASLRDAGAMPIFTDIVLRHSGYQDAAQCQRKRERNLRLLLMACDDQPNDALTLFYLGKDFLDVGDVDKAIAFLERCVKAQSAKTTILPKAYVLLASLKRGRGKEAEAWRHCQDGRELFPDDLELLFEEGLQCRNKNEPAAAQWCFERILDLPPQPCFVNVDAGLRNHLCREQLALAHRAQGHLGEAETQWRAALQQCPTFVPAWLGLAQLCLERKRLADLETVIEQLRQLPNSLSIISAIKANIAQWRGDHFAAKQLVRVGITQDPRSLWLRLTLIGMLLRENCGLDEAEKLVREVLAISPNHMRAKRFLQEIENRMPRLALAGAT